MKASTHSNMCVCVLVFLLMCMFYVFLPRLPPQATAAATRALRESSMNLNPEVDGTIIKVPVPK